jgi:hypothetical protein
MFAEAYLTNMLIAANTGVVGICPNGDGTFRLDYNDQPTQAQMDAASTIVQTFDYSTVESVLRQISDIDNSITLRMMQEAVANDPTVNPTWCGGAGGDASQHMAYLNNLKRTLRATLPR